MVKSYSGLNQFLAVCATRNLTAAAEGLGISQPALTQAVAKLERQLGVELLDRSTRPVGITPYGEVVMEYARALERGETDFTEKLAAMKTGSGGVVRIGCGPDWIHEILPMAVCRMTERSPDLRIELTVALNDDLRRKLDQGEVDLFFASISDAYFAATYDMRILVRDQMRVVAHVDHPMHRGAPKTLEMLSRARWTMTGDETFGRQLMRRIFSQAGLETPSPRIETNSVRAMINILRHGEFLGFLSQTHCNAYDDIAAVALADELPVRSGGVIWRRDRPLLPAARNLIAECEAVIAEILGE
jgi:DNA-binding transcriptional LysR family regulator